MSKDLSAILPDGREFAFWEQECEYNCTYHVDGSIGSDQDGDGSEDKPFATISKAAALAAPGVRVVIHEGIYRETVRPATGGSDPLHMVAFEAAPGEKVVISASEISHEFERSTDYIIAPDADGTEPVIWSVTFDRNSFDGYNPFAVVNCIHEKEWLRYARVDQQSSLVPYFLRRGMIYVDGKPLKQVQLYRLMSNEPGSYWVEEDGMKVHFRLPEDDNPADHLIEYSSREQNFVPAKQFQSYIRVSGLTMLHAANGAPVPQRGALSCARGHHWIIEDCVIAYANALGADIGNEGWSLKIEKDQQVGYTYFRRNRVLDAGVCGLAGIHASYCMIEDNEFAGTGWQHMEYGWEASALKLHDCVDTIFRRNIFRDSDNCDGLWLDCNNYNDRITGNLFLNIRSPHAMIFLECDRGLEIPREILIDNNILWKSERYDTPEALKKTITIDSTHWNEPFDLSTPIGEGIAGYGSDDIHIANNLIACMDGMGYSQNIIRGRMAEGRGGTSRNSIVKNNIFYDCRMGAVRLPNHDNTFDGNQYVKVPQGFLILTYPAPTEQLNLEAWRRFEGYDLNGGYAAFGMSLDEETLTLHVKKDKKTSLWAASEADGYSRMTSVKPDEKIEIDYFGDQHESRDIPGPFQIREDEFTVSIDPRRK